jgi:hypothetical protein
VRRRLLAIIAVTLLGLGGPGQATAAENETQAAASSDESVMAANEEPAATATPGANEQPDEDGAPTGGPKQETNSDSDAGVSNDASVDQSSDQAQSGGDSASGAGSAGASGGVAGQGGQEAGTAQQVQADAAASSARARNKADNVRVGTAGVRDAVAQRSATGADASASARGTTGQQGAGTAGSNDQQSAEASAGASSTSSSNTLLAARIRAPGNDARFDQSVHAGAAARAETQGLDGVQQDARAAARAEANDARNNAVELRIGSDGDSAGGSQSISADASASATGSAADASASATLSNPFNTFVSIRINSDGTTGPVSQSVSGHESETVNGVASERQTEDASDWTWDFDSNGIVIHFTSDGANTDLRIAVDDVTLHSPDEAPFFVWEWDMVFGAGGQPDCVMTSSLDAVRVVWLFDCDPEDQIAQTASTATSTKAPVNALSWAWNWLRPQLPEWSWEHNDVGLLPACGPTCSFLLDFNWISFEPTEASTVQTVAGEAGAAASGATSVEQTNEAFATATASAESVIEQVLIQTGDDQAALQGDQAALQEASIAQLVSAHAAAGLADVRNVAVGIGAHANQTNRAVTEVSAIAKAEIVQLLAQTQSGDDSFQTQAALQTASTSQQLHAGANSTVAHASNWDVSLGGTSTQASTSSARAIGAATASTWQVIEQEQRGNSSSQTQLAGQLADTTQAMEILAAAGVADARISSLLNGNSTSLGISVDVTGTGSSASEINQLSLQLQSGDEVAEQQESYQTASVTQTGSTLAAASAGGTLRYFLVPLAAMTAATPGETVHRLTAPTTSEPSFVPAGGIRGASRTRTAAPLSPRPVSTPRRPIFSREQAAATTAPRAIIVSNDSASSAGLAGKASKRAEDVEQAPGRSPRGLCLASCNGASTASAGTGSSGGAFLASTVYALSPVSVLGRWHTAPAGRRPAAVVLLRAKPG